MRPLEKAKQRFRNSGVRGITRQNGLWGKSRAGN